MRAIVTGHSAGLGAAISATLLQRGATVLGLSRRGNHSLADRHGARLAEIPIDLADVEALAALVESEQWAAFLASTDHALLFNNAGMLAPVAPVGAQGAVAIARAVQLNVAAPLMLSDAFVAHTAHCPDRRIVHVSSGAARNPYAGWGVYCATKAALDHHARVIAIEAAGHLRVASIAPGVIDTDMQAQLRACDATHFPSVERFKALKATGQLRSAEDIAERLAEFVLSDRFGRDPVADLRLPA